MARPVRIGAVNYLNTKPLIYELPLLAPEAELTLDVPSRLADRLGEGSHSTPAVAGGRMYVRTFTQLISVGGK